MSGKRQRTYRRVVTSFWTDPDLRRRRVTRDQRLLLLYLFTGPRTNLAGIYWLPLVYAAQEAELPLEDIQKWVSDELATYVTYDFETEEILVHRLAYHNVGEDLKRRDKRVKAIERNLADAHSTMLVEKFLALYPGWPIDRRKVAPALDNEGAYPRGIPKGHTMDLPKGHGKGQGEARAVAVAVAVAGAVAGAGAGAEGIQDPPTLGDPGVRETPASAREDAEKALGSERLHDALAIARANIVAIHGGTEDDVVIEGHRVGIGIEINAFKALCAASSDPPDAIARAIAFLPEVTELEPPVSLARWGAEDGGSVYAQCLSKAYAAGSRNGGHGTRAKSIPMSERTDPEIEARKQVLREQAEQLKRAEATT